MAEGVVVDISKGEQGTALTIEGELTIYNAQELTSLLREVDIKELPSTVKVDLSKVSEIDSSGLQIILSFQKHLKQHNRGLSFCKLSDAVQSLLNLYNLAGIFQSSEGGDNGS